MSRGAARVRRRAPTDAHARSIAPLPLRRSGAEGAQRRHLLDATALHRVRCGDNRALGELYDRYSGLALRLAMRIVNEPSEAEDVVHDAFAAIAERAAQYEPERGSVVAWLSTAVRNLALDRVRQRARRSRIVRDEVANTGGQQAADPELSASLRGERAALRAALRNLPASMQALIQGAFVEGLSYPEIALRDGVPLGTIKSRSARAFATLRAALAGDRDDRAARVDERAA